MLMAVRCWKATKENNAKEDFGARNFVKQCRCARNRNKKSKYVVYRVAPLHKRTLNALSSTDARQLRSRFSLSLSLAETQRRECNPPLACLHFFFYTASFPCGSCDRRCALRLHHRKGVGEEGATFAEVGEILVLTAGIGEGGGGGTEDVSSERDEARPPLDAREGRRVYIRGPRRTTDKDSQARPTGLRRVRVFCSTSFPSSPLFFFNFKTPVARRIRQVVLSPLGHATEALRDKRSFFRILVCVCAVFVFFFACFRITRLSLSLSLTSRWWWARSTSSPYFFRRCCAYGFFVAREILRILSLLFFFFVLFFIKHPSLHARARQMPHAKKYYNAFAQCTRLYARCAQFSRVYEGRSIYSPLFLRTQKQMRLMRFAIKRYRKHRNNWQFLREFFLYFEKKTNKSP